MTIKQPPRVFVTAGATGIGHAIVRRFKAAHAGVHICDIDATAVAQACAGGDVSGSIADVGDPVQMRAAAADIVKALGGIDVLVNNAGIGGPRVPIEEVSDADWDAVLRVNVSGTFHAIREFVPLMKQQRSGCIINISSTSARTGLPNRTPYVVSKAAIGGLTQNLARELGPFNIRCNALLPGSIENERGRNLMRAAAERQGISYEQALEKRLSFISMRTRIDPDEIGDAAVFLASPAAKHITGQLLSVCGNAEWEG